MTRRTLLFGPPGHMKPIKMPQGGGSHSPVGYTETVQYLSGRAGIRRSLGSHRAYDWTWRGKRADIAHLLDCADGMYGPGPFYFYDPVWERENILPQHWATPSLGAYDAPVIYGSRRPESVPMAANDGTWPAEGASFRRDPNAPMRTIFLPFTAPDQVILIWCAAGSAVLEYGLSMNGEDPASWPAATLVDPTLPVNRTVPTAALASSGAAGIKLRVNVASPATSATIYGIRAVAVSHADYVSIMLGNLPANMSSGFVGGRGHSGVEFEQHPSVTPYSVPYDSIGATARLVEVDY